MWEYKIYEDDLKLIKSKDIYKTALDNNANFTQEEKKIVDLNKLLFKDFNQVNVQQDTSIFIESIAKQYEDYYYSTALYNGHKLKDEINKLLENKAGNKSVAYFADNLAFQNLSFLMKTFFQEIAHHMFQLNTKNNGIMNEKKNLEKYLKFIKVNNYLNIMTQINFIWDGLDDSMFALPNYYGKW